MYNNKAVLFSFYNLLFIYFLMAIDFPIPDYPYIFIIGMLFFPKF